MQTLYRLDFPDGRSYIGITSLSMNVRARCHRNAAWRGSKSLVHDAWRRLGEPKVITLAVVEDHMRHETEIAAVRVYGTLMPEGYNMQRGGPTNTMTVPGERERLAERMRGNAYTKGRKLSDEHKAAISRAGLGNQWAKGAERSEEFRRNASEKLKAFHAARKQNQLQRKENAGNT